MALPSSPQLLPHISPDLPSSPPSFLPASSHSATAQLGRKRPLSDFDNSSDPLFSDDPSGAEDVTGYERPKRKRYTRGPWYTLGRNSEPSPRESVPKRDAFRNVDSGVWMGSDGSQHSVGSVISGGSMLQSLAIRDGMDEASMAESAFTAAENVARDVVETCVENGREVVDLSGLGLVALTSSILKPLHQLIRQPHIDLTRPPSETEFTPLTPSIKLFLAKNSLTTLPAELFNLGNLTVLSLRGNALPELPSCVGRLRRLKELNISGNRIQCLPWELLDLMSCGNDRVTVHIRPNPLRRPTKITGSSQLTRLDLASTAKNENEQFSCHDDAWAYYDSLKTICVREGILDARVELELRLKLGRMLRNQQLHEAAHAAGAEPHTCHEELLYLASSEVQYLGIDGSPHSKRESSSGSAAVFPAVTNSSAVANPWGAAPSLFELATAAVQKHFSLEDIPAGLPTRVRRVLQHQAAYGAEYGNQHCSRCHQQFVIARAEWTEYWFHGHPSQPELTQETVLPFARKVCSWRCATPSGSGAFRC